MPIQIDEETGERIKDPDKIWKHVFEPDREIDDLKRHIGVLNRENDILEAQVKGEKQGFWVVVLVFGPLAFLLGSMTDL